MQPLKDRIKRLIVDTLMLPMNPQEIADDQLLFGPGGLGLDSVDALQLVVMLDKNFGVKIADSNAARETLQSVATIVAAVERQQSAV